MHGCARPVSSDLPLRMRRARAPSPPSRPKPSFVTPTTASFVFRRRASTSARSCPSRDGWALPCSTSTASPSKNVASVDGQDIGWFAWVNDERLVFSIVDLQAGLAEQRGGGLFAINRDGSDFRELAPTPEGAGGSHVALPLHRSARHAAGRLRRHHDRHERPERALPDVYRVNTRTGRRTLKSSTSRARSSTGSPIAADAVRAAVVDDKGTTRVYWRPARGCEVGRDRPALACAGRACSRSTSTATAP